MTRLEAKTSKAPFVCLGALACFFGLMSLGNLSQLRHGFKMAPIIWALLPVFLFAPVFWLVRRGHSRSVKVFTEDGLTRNDGSRFSWADLACVIEQIHRDPRAGYGDRLWRVEIHFKNGQCAWVIPQKVANRAEVLTYVGALPCEHKQVRV